MPSFKDDPMVVGVASILRRVHDSDWEIITGLNDEAVNWKPGENTNSLYQMVHHALDVERLWLTTVAGNPRSGRPEPWNLVGLYEDSLPRLDEAEQDIKEPAGERHRALTRWRWRFPRPPTDQRREHAARCAPPVGASGPHWSYPPDVGAVPRPHQREAQRRRQLACACAASRGGEHGVCPLFVSPLARVESGPLHRAELLTLAVQVTGCQAQARTPLSCLEREYMADQSPTGPEQSVESVLQYMVGGCVTPPS